MPDLFAGIKYFTKPSNNDLPDKIKELIQSLINEEYLVICLPLYTQR